MISTSAGTTSRMAAGVSLRFFDTAVTAGAYRSRGRRRRAEARHSRRRKPDRRVLLPGRGERRRVARPPVVATGTRCAPVPRRRLVPSFLSLRAAVAARIRDDDFSAQVALALAIANTGVQALPLPM